MDTENLKNDILKAIDDWDTDPNDIDKWQALAENYCSPWTLVDSYKDALRIEVVDQIDNHYKDTDGTEHIDLLKALTSNN